MGNIDLNESKRLSRVLAGKEKPKDRSQEILARMQAKTGFRASGNEIPGLETKSYLFFFKGKYYFISGSEMKKITKNDVETTLNDNPDIKIFYLCSDTICPMPGVLSGKVKKATMVKNDKSAVEYINQKTGLSLTTKDL